MLISGIPTTFVLHHRRNRRRERPGSRTRRTFSRKSNIQSELNEGILDARDPNIYLPSDKPSPSPLFRQNFDQSWQRWKAREAEEQSIAEMERNMLLLAQEQQRLFGEDIDDDVSLDLKPAMLDVVLRLFGDIDYTDP